VVCATVVVTSGCVVVTPGCVVVTSGCVVVTSGCVVVVVVVLVVVVVVVSTGHSGGRVTGPLVSLSCTGLDPSELFDHEALTVVVADPWLAGYEIERVNAVVHDCQPPGDQPLVLIVQ
jgi:hypothetical protein